VVVNPVFIAESLSLAGFLPQLKQLNMCGTWTSREEYGYLPSSVERGDKSRGRVIVPLPLPTRNDSESLTIDQE
jgi:hypothetical protein